LKDWQAPPEQLLKAAFVLDLNYGLQRLDMSHIRWGVSYKRIGISHTGCFLCFLIGSIHTTLAKVISNRPRKNTGILQDKANLLS
jgi:hypothetical protein